MKFTSNNIVYSFLDMTFNLITLRGNLSDI